MKKQLLLFILPMLLFTATMQAQIKVWNFAGTNLVGYDNIIGDNTKIEAILYSGTGGNIGTSGAVDTANEIGSFGSTSDKVFYVNDSGKDRLRGNTVGITRYNEETKTIYEPFFGTGAPYGRFYVNGSGSSSSRYFGFNLLIGDKITMYYYIDTSVQENLTIESPSGGITNIAVDNAAGKIAHEVHLDATENGVYKIYSQGGKLCVGRIYEDDVKLSDGVVLSLKEKASPVSTNLQAVGNRVYVSNVKSSSEITIYSITGALVKSFKTNSDTNFAFKSGLYIATIKTIEGQKSVKLLLN